MEEMTKKERKMLRRQERTASQQSVRRTRKAKKLLVWGGVLLGIAFALFFGARFFTPVELGTDHSQAVLFEGASHVPDGTRVSYQSNPPTSGNHWSVPLRDGTYDTEKPDEAVVHSLEHGRVWVSYRPDIAQEAISQIKQAVGSTPQVILTPRQENDTDIALVAWTRLDAFNLNDQGEVDAKRITDFINRYRNKGPEYIPQNTGSTYE